RWWESNPRYRLSVPVRLSSGENQIEGEILDLSAGGCFIKLRHELTQDQAVGVQFRVFAHDLDCKGTVVWRTQSTVTHPKGIGIKFEQLPRTQRRTLRLITKRLRKISAFYGRSRYLMNQEDFLKHLEELEAKMRA
ncbi:MAG: PilZ domain-containing protein, partial [Bdellovibrionota bacterium]